MFFCYVGQSGSMESVHFQVRYRFTLELFVLEKSVTFCMLVKIIQEHCNEQRCIMCWLGLVDLNILYVFFVGDISLDLFNVRCREDTLSYARGGRKRIINKY